MPDNIIPFPKKEGHEWDLGICIDCGMYLNEVSVNLPCPMNDEELFLAEVEIRSSPPEEVIKELEPQIIFLSRSFLHNLSLGILGGLIAIVLFIVFALALLWTFV